MLCVFLNNRSAVDEGRRTPAAGSVGGGPAYPSRGRQSRSGKTVLLLHVIIGCFKILCVWTDGTEHDMFPRRASSEQGAVGGAVEVTAPSLPGLR